MEKINKIVDSIKNQKEKAIIVLVVILVVIFLVYNMFTGSPETPIKSFVADCNSVDVDKLYEQVDWVGVYLLYSKYDELGNEYENFWNEYENAKNSNEYKEFKKKLDINFENATNEIEDFLQENEIELEVKKINKFEQLSKNIYVGEARIQAIINGKKETMTDEIIIIKRGLKYYLIAGEVIESALLDFIL